MFNFFKMCFCFYLLVFVLFNFNILPFIFFIVCHFFDIFISLTLKLFNS